MIFKTIVVEATFESGMVLGGLSSHLAANGSGWLNAKRSFLDGYAEVEVAVYNPLVMSYVEDKLAAYV
jgi:hypothetical protein